MNQSDLIEAVVKEVRRVLAERGISVAPVSGGTAQTPSVSAKPSPKVFSQAVPSASPSSDSAIGSSDLTVKQVSVQRDIEGVTNSIIRVTKKAVITPLATDYAKSKGIKIERIEGSPVISDGFVSSQSTVAVALTVSPDFSGDSGIVNSLLKSKGFQIRNFSERTYETAVKKLCGSVASGAVQFGVCIEKTGMEGPIHANRNTKIRAVHCRGTIDARAARVDYNANVIVIDSASDPDAVISGFTGI